eukprot:scaffold3_cov389-Prasinococcus_capsulatus_cf.AAC.6
MDGEQEEELRLLFERLPQDFHAMEKEKDLERREAKLKHIAQEIKEGMRLVKDFEREARADGEPEEQIGKRKKTLVKELNAFIAQKKKASADLKERQEKLLQKQWQGGQSSIARAEVETGGADTTEGLSSRQLMDIGRKKMKKTDESIDRSRRVVAETIEVGTVTAAELKEQTNQMQRIVNDLDEIKFSFKKTFRLIRDVSKSMATDR